MAKLEERNNEVAVQQHFDQARAEAFVGRILVP
jgi:hypothetical protein